jgi:hypothetical protein
MLPSLTLPFRLKTHVFSYAGMDFGAGILAPGSRLPAAAAINCIMSKNDLVALRFSGQTNRSPS